MASATNVIRSEIGLQAISEYLAMPGTRCYIEFTGTMMEMKITHASTAPLEDLILEPNLTIRCLSAQSGLIKKLYRNKMHSPSINDSLHSHDLQAKLAIADRCHLVLEDSRTLEDLPEMAATLDFVTVEGIEEDGIPIPTEPSKPKQPLHKQISLGLRDFFSFSKNKKKPLIPSVSARLVQGGNFESSDSAISMTYGAAAVPDEVPASEQPVVQQPPSQASRTALSRLQENFEHFTRLLQPLELLRAQLNAAKDALRQITSELDQFSTDILESKDFDKLLDEKRFQSGALLSQISTLEQQVTDLEARKNELQEFFRDELYNLRDNEEFQRDFGTTPLVTTLLDQLARVGAQQDAPLPRDLVRRKNPLETIQEKRLEITQKLERILSDVSTKTTKKDPSGLLFSWNSQTNSLEVESKFTLFGTAKVFIPLNANGTGIYCKEGSEREIEQLIRIITPDETEREGAIRHAKDALYATMQSFVRKP